jgi:hypothetical protein
MKIKAFIIMYNRLTIPKKLAENLADTGCEPILLDNSSSYPPLLEWYKSCPFKVHTFNQRYGERVFWDSGLFKEYDDEYYIVTDHDLDISNVPLDYTEVLIKGLENKDITKCGLSLDIDDLPDTPYGKDVIGCELKYWGDKDFLGNYIAGVDTTFAMYDRKRQTLGWDHGDKFYYGSRLPKPYTAKHMPWYLTEESFASNEEEKYYHTGCTNFWSTVFKRRHNIKI